MKSMATAFALPVLLALAFFGLPDVADGLIVRDRIANSTVDHSGLSKVTQEAKHGHNASSNSSDKNGQWLFFDFGFFDGTDSLSYLSQGMRVVAVEADPSLVFAGWTNPSLVPYIQQGTLKILNYAIALNGVTEPTMTTFYLNKCSKEWNSFQPSVGCRSCVPPHAEDPTKQSCTAQQVQSMPCAKVFQDYGIPVYMKADMEGAEAGCYEALKAYPKDQRPNLISGEVTDAKLVDVFAGLGYTSFKVVKQASGHSGGWGDYAKDCRVGGAWRSYASAAAELKKVTDKVNPAPATDPCPSIVAGYGVWYDIHASRMPPQA
jgi:hypothetical protein